MAQNEKVRLFSGLFHTLESSKPGSVSPDLIEVDGNLSFDKQSCVKQQALLIFALIFKARESILLVLR
jgi:hypothetical protein